MSEPDFFAISLIAAGVGLVSGLCVSIALAWRESAVGRLLLDRINQVESDLEDANDRIDVLEQTNDTLGAVLRRARGEGA